MSEGSSSGPVKGSEVAVAATERSVLRRAGRGLLFVCLGWVLLVWTRDYTGPIFTDTGGAAVFVVFVGLFAAGFATEPFLAQKFAAANAAAATAPPRSRAQQVAEGILGIALTIALLSVIVYYCAPDQQKLTAPSAVDTQAVEIAPAAVADRDAANVDSAAAEKTKADAAKWLVKKLAEVPNTDPIVDTSDDGKTYRIAVDFRANEPGCLGIKKLGQSLLAVAKIIDTNEFARAVPRVQYWLSSSDRQRTSARVIRIPDLVDALKMKEDPIRILTRGRLISGDATIDQCLPKMAAGQDGEDWQAMYGAPDPRLEIFEKFLPRIVEAERLIEKTKRSQQLQNTEHKCVTFAFTMHLLGTVDNECPGWKLTEAARVIFNHSTIEMLKREEADPTCRERGQAGADGILRMQNPAILQMFKDRDPGLRVAVCSAAAAVINRELGSTGRGPLVVMTK
jgi:hypothetical protein